MFRFIISSIIGILSFFFSGEVQAQTKKSKVHHKTQVHAKRGKTLHKKSVRRPTHTASKRKRPNVYYGTASYYADRFRGRKTAGGASYRQNSMTAACNRLPLGTLVRVTNMENKKSIVVRINDRMSSRNRRLIDLPKPCAKRLGFTQKGTARVKVEPLSKVKPSARR